MPTATPFNNLITFSRGSNATVVGPNGLIQWAPNNVLLQSESLDNASWTKQASTITANNTLAPDGTTTADKIVEAATTAAHGVRQSAALSALVATLSFYAKKAEREFVNVWAFGGNIDTTATRAGFNLTTGAATVRPGQTATIQDVGNGWYRCSVSIILTATGSPTVHIGPNIDALTQDYTGDGTSGAFIWGAQLELGSTATTYNPTTVKNRLGFSEAFDNAAWTKGGASIVTGAQANPINGLFNAQKMMENTAAATQHYVAQSVTALTSATPITLSVYAKAGERRYIALLEGASNKGQYFDLQTGTVGGVLIGAPTSASITAIGNGWYRCTMTTPVLSTTASLEVYLSNSGTTTTYTGDGNSGVYIYGAQLSDSASLDPYVPTPGAAPSSTAFYGPRFDFDPVTLQPRGLLVEEQRTNLTLRSDDFANASWVKSSYTVSADAGVAPDGTLTADQITTTGGNGSVTQTITVVASTNYVFSFYARKGTAANARYSVYNASGGADIIAPTNYPAEFQSGSWVRVVVPFTTPVGCTSINIYTHRDTASAGTTLVWGAQLEAGSFATSYIPTVASTVTRSADVTLISGQNFAQWYRQDEGAFIAEFNVLDQGGVTFTVSDGTGNNRFTGYPAGSVQLEITTGGVLQAALDGGTITPNTNVKVASAYAANNAALSLNGGSAVSDASVTLPTVNQSRIGANVGGGNLLNGWFRSFRFIPARAADFQLQGLST